MVKKRKGYLGGGKGSPVRSSSGKSLSGSFKSGMSNFGASAKSAMSKVGTSARSAASSVAASAKSAASNLAASAKEKTIQGLQNTKEALKPENISKGIKKAAIGTAFGIAKVGLNGLIPPIPFHPVSTLRDGMNKTLGTLEQNVKNTVNLPQGPERDAAFKKISDDLIKDIDKHGPLLKDTFGVNILDQGFKDNLAKTITEHGPSGDIGKIMGGINSTVNAVMEKNSGIFGSGANPLTFTDPAGQVHTINMKDSVKDLQNAMQEHIDQTNNDISKKIQEAMKAGKDPNTMEKLFPEKTEEQKQEEKEKEEENRLAFQLLLEELKRLYNDFKLAPGKVKIYIILGILTILVAAGLSLFYIIRLFLDYKNNLLIKNPINFESLDYNISRSISFNPLTLFRKNIKYKFVLFLILPILSFIFISIALYYSVKEPNKQSIQSIIYILIGIVLVQSILSIIINCAGILSIRQDINATQKKISEFNNYVYLNLYRNERFLKVLQLIPTNSFSMIKAIQSAMDTIPEEDKSDPEQIAKVLLTLNIYIHLQKMGFKNPNIKSAFKLFDESHTNDPKLFTPSDFLFRQTTYIHNYSNHIIDIYKNYKGNTDISLLPGFISTEDESISEVATNIVNTNSLFEFQEAFVGDESSSSITDNTFELAKEPIEGWIRNLNELAYKMDSNKAFGSFIKVLILIAVISILPLIILVFGRKIREKIFKIISFLTKSKTDRINMRINETQLLIDHLTVDLNNVKDDKKKNIIQGKISIYKNRINELKSQLTEAEKEKNK